ncbi:hypothetical protein C4K39_6261 [Pseudomonas sessilinigenes]|nr:hypothetical protein C4K39_6261 [Pseudomonas sessilinigenes]
MIRVPQPRPRTAPGLPGQTRQNPVKGTRATDHGLNWPVRLGGSPR